MQVPGSTNVALVTFVIPINSAVNPMLYTVNSIMEQRRKVRLQKLLEFLNKNRNNLHNAY